MKDWTCLQDCKFLKIFSKNLYMKDLASIVGQIFALDGMLPLLPSRANKLTQYSLHKCKLSYKGKMFLIIKYSNGENLH